MESSYTFTTLDPRDFALCGTLWDLEKHADLAERFRRELREGNRVTYLCREGKAVCGEVSLVRNMDEPDYTLPGRRLYVSHLAVRRDLRRRGIGAALLDYAAGRAREMGASELSVGVDLDNYPALRLYWRTGFTRLLYVGEDAGGRFVKLLREI